MGDDIKSEIIEALGRLSKLAKQGRDAQGNQIRQGLAVLHAVAILQLYNDPGPDALEVLQDTKKCADRLGNLEDGSDSGIAEILIEVLLSMLAATEAAA